jgi:hypothetical protein
VKFKTKKIAYFLNDLTNILLKKEKEDEKEKLKKIIKILLFFLIISLILNVAGLLLNTGLIRFL